MRKEGENLFKWLWRKYNEFYDEAGFSQVGNSPGKTGRIRKKFKTFQFRSILWFCFLSAWLAW